MAATSDDLTRPLGISAPTSSNGTARLPIWLVGVSGGILVGCAALVTSSAFFGDERGGIPSIRVAISAKPVTEDKPEATRLPTVTAGLPPRQSAGEVENASGVSVVRPAGTVAPEAVIVRVPDASELAPGEPDGRLLERTRFGLLPKVGPGGLKPVDAYARPVGELPNGGVPSGQIAIVVGGLGIGQSATALTLAKLPAAVTLAIAPHGSDLEGLARRVRQGGHEVMLQVPMEPFDYPDSDPGPHTLFAAAKPADNIDHLNWALGRFTGYVGVTNYMGGKLTADARAIAPLLREMAGRGLAFLDDGSSSRSVAGTASGGMRSGRADAVVDAVAQPDAIDRALERLETLANSGKVAIGTASALPLSVDRIGRWAASLAAKGILLVPVTTALRGERREGAVR